MAVARLRHLYETFEHLIHEIAKFGVVGAVNYAVDVGLFNVLVTGSLHGKPLTAKLISSVVAATSSYFMNRHWTWRNKARHGLIHEYSRFIGLSSIAVAITLGWLAFGEYALGQHSLIARNFWGNIVGVGTAMVFRFWSFKRWVFVEPEPERTDDALKSALV